MRNRGTNAPVVEPKPKINNTEIVTALRADGGGIVHCRPSSKSDKGFTTAYIRKGRRLIVTTAVQHSADTFSKKVGTKVAIERLRAGNCIVLPLKADESPTILADLKRYFN
jgi:hypothetical protein